MKPTIKVDSKKGELEFYKDYFYIISLRREEKLTPREIDLAAAFAYLAMFVEPGSKNAKNFKLLKELTGMGPQYLAAYINKLVDKGILIKDEDGLIGLISPVKNVVKTVKNALTKNDKFSFDLTIEYEVTG